MEPVRARGNYSSLLIANLVVGIYIQQVNLNQPDSGLSHIRTHGRHIHNEFIRGYSAGDNYRRIRLYPGILFN